MLTNAKQTAKSAGNQLIQLSQSNTPNYKVAAAASSILALIYMTSSLEGGYFSSYLSLAGVLFTTGIAIRQFGVQRAYQNLTSSMQGFFKPANSANQDELVEMDRDILKKIHKSLDAS